MSLVRLKIGYSVWDTIISSYLYNSNIFNTTAVKKGGFNADENHHWLHKKEINVRNTFPCKWLPQLHNVFSCDVLSNTEIVDYSSFTCFPLCKGHRACNDIIPGWKLTKMFFFLISEVMQSPNIYIDSKRRKIFKNPLNSVIAFILENI